MELVNYICNMHQKGSDLKMLQKNENFKKNNTVVNISEKNEFKNLSDNINKVKEKISSFKLDRFGEIVYNRNREAIKEIKCTTPNLEKILEFDKRFVNRIRYNAFSEKIEILENNRTHNLDDFDESKILSMIEGDYHIFNEKKFSRAIQNVSKRHTYHPLKQILEGLTWDGVDRITTMFTDTLGAEANAYNANVAKIMLLGAINRLYHAGCKFDYCVILASENMQGLGKSSLVRKLALQDRYYTDSLSTLETDTNTLQLLRGKWFIELGELKSLNRCKGGVEGVKQFLSNQSDNYRDSYAKHAKDYPRTCIFVGTTNRGEYLIDDTGNRRFLPVVCANNENPESLAKIKYHMYEDTEKIRNYVLQLWGQAMHIFKSGNYSLVLDKANEAELERLHKKARVHNPNIDLIQNLVDTTTATYIGINSVYTEVFNDGNKKVCPKSERNEIRAILNSTDIKGVEKVNKVVSTPYGFKERGWKIVRQPEQHKFKQMSLKDSEELEKALRNS